MSRPFKILASLLAAAVVAAAVTGIAFWSANSLGQPPRAGLYVNGRLVEDPGPMLTVGNYAFSFDEYRHYFLLNRSVFESYYGENLWDDDPDGDFAWNLRKSVELELTTLRAWLQIAEEEGVSLAQEDMDEIEKTISAQKAEQGERFEDNLAVLYFPSEALYRKITEWQALSEKIQTEYGEQLKAQVEDATIAAAEQEYRDNYITAKHILIQTDSAAEDAEQAKADALAKAEGIIADILADAAARSPADDAATDDGDSDGDATDATANNDTGDTANADNAEPAMAPEALAEAFDAQMHLHSEDTGLETNPDGYTFTEGEMVEVFYETAAALPEYEMSEPVWSETESYSGYHIILRPPLDESELETFTEGKVTEEVNRLKQERVDAIIDAFTVTGNQYYDALKPEDIQ